MSFELDQEHEEIFTKILYDAIQEKFTPKALSEMLQEFSKNNESTRISKFIINPNDARERKDMVGLNLKVTLEPNDCPKKIKI
ncbi:hypothetical protein [Methanobrevibacter sp.]|uniref:hypothetical protein n=1 Tax=Methanobrevibacter sp. TaxID=66852 RepID=UPI0038641BEC